MAGSAVVDACGVNFNQKIVDTLHKLHANGDSVVRLRVLHFLALLAKKNHQVLVFSDVNVIFSLKFV